MVATIDTHRTAAQQALAELRAFGGRLNAIADQHTAALSHWRSLADNRANQLQSCQSDLDLLRTELTSAQAKIEALENDLMLAQADADAAADESAASRHELEKVIERSARVAEEAARHRRQAAAERAGFEAELKALRHLLVQNAVPDEEPLEAELVTTSMPPLARMSARGEARRAQLRLSDQQETSSNADAPMLAIDPRPDPSHPTKSELDRETSDCVRNP